MVLIKFLKSLSILVSYLVFGQRVPNGFSECNVPTVCS